MDGYHHYIRVNEAGTIVYGFSSAFEQNQVGDICINQDASRHFHESFNESLIDNQGVYLFKYSGSLITPRTAQEIDADVSLLPPKPKTDAEKIAELEQLVADLASLQLGV